MSDVFDEIGRREPDLNAFVHLDLDAARAELAAPRPGRLSGRLVAVKDNIAVRGAPWAAGSSTREGRAPATTDAEVVRRLRAAGAVVLGTTNLDELAMGASTETSDRGPTRNPHDRTRTAGGSSGGAAAAVAAYGVLAVGTDTGGSIREPAAMCGVVGVAPSPGAVPAGPDDGVVPFARTLDRVGPLARTVREAALLHEVMADADGLLAATETGAVSGAVDGATIGVIEPMSGVRNAVEVLACFERLCTRLRDQGADLVPIRVAHFGDLLDTYLTITSVEARPVLREHARLGSLGREASSRLRIGEELLGTDVHTNALLVRDRIVADVAAAFGRCEVMLSPTVPLLAPPLGRPGMADPLARPRTDWWTVEANLAGIAAASVPIGTAAGLPVGAQLMAPAGRDDRLYRFMAVIEGQRRA